MNVRDPIHLSRSCSPVSDSKRHTAVTDMGQARTQIGRMKKCQSQAVHGEAVLNVEQALKKAGMGAERVLNVLAQILMDRAAEAQRGRTGVAATTLMGRSAEKVHAEEKTPNL